MKPLNVLGITLFVTNIAITLVASEPIHHEMRITLNPAAHHIEVEDRITIPDSYISRNGNKIEFILHDGLNPQATNSGVSLSAKKETANSPFFVANTEIKVAADRIPLNYFEVILPDGVNTLSLKYSGIIYHPLKRQGEGYVRNFRETPGIISEEGVYLSGSTFWYPWFNDDLVTFDLELHSPEGWQAISQGKRVQNASFEKEKTSEHWESSTPQEEIYIVGGQFHEYQKEANGIQTLVFLRSPDEELADKYLNTTAEYLDMYQRLIGVYPYKKFALVENFWETGYGMPSFTLLGPRIIRFPFILHSSYPHEILHNWWGNGVFVDYSSGNWSEGLTAYLADHLIREQQGTATGYRRTALQNYRNYVSGEKEFPLTEFRSRHSSATEAVGYGKTMMFFHMLRRRLGDELFTDGLKKFFARNLYHRATFQNLEEAFNEASGKKLGIEFSQWTTKTGAPELQLENTWVKNDGEKYVVTTTLKQVQDGPEYLLQVPIAVHLLGQEKPWQTSIEMVAKHLEFSLSFKDQPLWLDIDPEFDLFRRVDRREAPLALSRAFGEESALIILPNKATDEMKGEYNKLGELWRASQSGQLEIKSDSDIKEIPGKGVVWVFGWENRFLPDIIKRLANEGVTLTNDNIRIKEIEIERPNHSFVLTVPSATERDLTLVFVATDNSTALQGLGRKLSHYGKYSYLGFKGEEPVNILKGEWPVVNSPLSVRLSHSGKTVGSTLRSKFSGRKALTYPIIIQEAPPPLEMITRQELEPERQPNTGVSFGTVPDLDYSGKGVRLKGVIPGSSAEQADLRQGDVLIEVNYKQVDNINEYIEILKNLKPDDIIIATFMRGSEEKTIRSLLMIR